jgi:DMSO/TMAO reductase YedYZ heme-binding membrane subunit
VTGVLATGTPALWYLTRGTGAVTLILLTLSLVLGILEVKRWTAGPSPRFAVAALHRSVSLLVLALLAVHILTAVLDTFAPIRLLDAVVPFTGVYRPVWLGLGALALDGLLAVTITSLVRRRLGLRAWRSVHWLAYACWPVAAIHGLGTGSDVKATWMLALTAACAATIVAAVAVRLLGGDPQRLGARLGAGAAVVAVVLAAVLWVHSGPLAPGWAKRSGTPAALLAARPVASRTIAAAPLANGFSSSVLGSLRQGRSRGGRAVVDLRLRTTGARIRVRMSGRPADGGGLVMSRSAVTVGPPGDAAHYRGRVTALGATSVRATVGDRRGGTLRLALALQLDGPQVGGTVVASPARGGDSG